MYMDEYKNDNKKKKNRKGNNRKDYSRNKVSKYKLKEGKRVTNDEMEMLKIQNLILCEECDSIYHNSLTECPRCES
jgi:hypothetical protein